MSSNVILFNYVLGSFYDFDTLADGTFHRCVFIPSCYTKCITLCKPFISLDGCHLKGIFNKTGVLLSANMKDGNNQNVLVALGIVPIENEANWTWFLNRLKISNLQLSEQLMFVSDRQKGSLNITINNVVFSFLSF
jgi:hypothetical protein